MSTDTVQLVKRKPVGEMMSMEPVQSVKQKPTDDKAKGYQLQEVTELGDNYEEHDSRGLDKDSDNAGLKFEVEPAFISSEDGDDDLGQGLMPREPEDCDNDLGQGLMPRVYLDAEDQQKALKSVTTIAIYDSINDLDSELKELIEGHIAAEQKEEPTNFERENTIARYIEMKENNYLPGAMGTGIKGEKAPTKVYIFFIILFSVCYAVGMYVITTLEDYNIHNLVYASILWVLASLTVALDLWDKLPNFISYWENFWNVDKVALRINVNWRTGDSRAERMERKHTKREIMGFIRNRMGWNRCCLMWCNIRSKIEDKSVIVSALIKDGKKAREVARELVRLKEYPGTIENIVFLDKVKLERRAPHFFLFLFFIVALVDYILLKITDDEDGYNVPELLRHIADIVLFYLALILMIVALLSNWTRFSFMCSEKAYIQGILNISLFGFLVLNISRILRPPVETKKWEIHDISAITWHKYHDWNKQIEGVVLTLVVLWGILVLFFVISIAAFAEFANEAADWGVGPALSCFIAFAMVIMLAPPAPGNIIDVFGGFLIVLVLIKDDSERWNFLTATAVAFITVVALHYTGACFQWMIGKLPFAQQWMNRTMPIEMLAASDAVLGDANWFKVGLVGFVFLDTANGLNQGRIEMEFWTQLFSEWGAFPNGISLVTFGATLAINGLGCEEGQTTGCLTGNLAWTAQALPLLFIMSGFTQIVGTGLGLTALAGSLNTDKYVMSREKWYIVHRMMGVGYIPTKIGWQEDVYELASTKNPERTPYFEKACKMQHEWLEERKKCETPGDVTKEGENFKKTKWIPLRYRDHMKYLLRKVMTMEFNEKAKFKKLFIKKDREEILSKVGMWDDVETNKVKKIVQAVLVVLLTICFYFGVFGFYVSLDLEMAVKQGLDFLFDISWYYWVSAGIFILCASIYYWDKVKKCFLGIFTGIYYFLKCCPVNEEMETGFLTPRWPLPIEDKSKNTGEGKAVVSSTGRTGTL